MARTAVLFGLIAVLSAYQWPVSQASIEADFLSGDGRTGEVNLGLTFSGADTAVFFADGEVIYQQNAQHPLSLPQNTASLIVLRHQGWLANYRISGMEVKNFSRQSDKRVTEGDLVGQRREGEQETRVELDFYDLNNEVTVSPWLMLPEENVSTQPFNLLAAIPKEAFQTRMRPESYLSPNDYTLLYRSDRVPLRVQVHYDQLKISDIDLSTVSQRAGQLFTNSGLIKLSDLRRATDLELSSLQVGGAPRQWHILQIDAYFNALNAISQQYRVYVLPPTTPSRGER